jgi:hypothetical protein
MAALRASGCCLLGCDGLLNLFDNQDVAARLVDLRGDRYFPDPC